MKKIISIITVIAVIVLAAVVPVSAESGNVVVTASSGVAAVGEEVTFTVTVTGLPQVLSAKIVPAFDETVFELVSGWWLVPGFVDDFDPAIGDGVIAWQEPTQFSGDVLTFILRAKDTAEGAACTVGCTLSYWNAQDILVSVENTLGADVTVGCVHRFDEKNTDDKYLVPGATCPSDSVYYYSCSLCGATGQETFTTTLSGDVNGDGTVNLRDVTILMQHCARYDVTVDTVAADVAGDGVLDLKDVMILIKSVAGWTSVRMGHLDDVTVITEPTGAGKGESRLTCTRCGDSANVPVYYGEDGFIAVGKNVAE